MRCLAISFFLCFSAIAAAAEGPTMAPPESNLQSIFNGKDLDGWDGDPKRGVGISPVRFSQ